MEDSSGTSSEVAVKLEELNKEFFEFCEERQTEGAETYGPIAFLRNDMLQYMLEELADLSNYARFMYIKLRLLEEMANARGIDMSAGSVGEVRIDHEVPFGPTAFTGVSEIFNLLSKPEESR